jgi:hypothetical protein
MFNLPHLASRVFGTPLMIARAKLEVILSVLAPRLAGAFWSRSTQKQSLPHAPRAEASPRCRPGSIGSC